MKYKKRIHMIIMYNSREGEDTRSVCDSWRFFMGFPSEAPGTTIASEAEQNM